MYRNVKAPYVISRKFRSPSVEHEAESKDESILEDFVNCYHRRMFIGLDTSLA